MLIYRRTSLMESSAQTLVNTVNCVGVMGKGIAKEFKLREPQMFAAYKQLCDEKKLAPGKLWLWRGLEFWTLNFPTKMHWRNPSKIEWIEAGLKKFVAGYERLGIREISFPRLGCGNGGLDWEEVRPLMERYLSGLPIEIYIHDYSVDVGLPEHLAAVAEQLRHEPFDEQGFSGFLSALNRAVALSGECLVNLTSGDRITAQNTDDNGLLIGAGTESWQFEREDLRGVWVSLRNGLLTKEKAGWSTTGGSEALLSILSVLPQVRPVEIQSICGGPELAIELRPEGRGSALVPPAQGQYELAWH